MANKDLRDWIAGIEAAGELKIIKGAEPKEEIGGFVDIYMRKMGNPAGDRLKKRVKRRKKFEARMEGMAYVSKEVRVEIKKELAATTKK